MRDVNVLIAGGGIGGLALARALSARGIACEVFERAGALRAIGAAVAIQPNAIKALRAIDRELADDAIAIGEELDMARRGTVVLDPSGKVLASFAQPDHWLIYGAPSVTIRRADLHALLARGLPAGVVHTGRELTSFDETPDGVVARFRDGEPAPGDLLVGADGLRGAVRARVVGDGEPIYRGYTSWRALAPRPEHPLCAPGTSFSTFGRGGFFSGRALGDRLYWHAELFADRGEIGALDQPALAARLLEHVRGWHEPIEALVRASDEIVGTDIYDRDPVSTWSRGRVTLLGDAAHPTSPHLGQGCAMALEDAVVLAKAIAEAPDAPSAFARYEVARVARTTRVVLASRRQGRTQVTRSRATMLRRDLSFRLFDRLQNPGRGDPPFVRWLFGWEP